MADDSFTSVNEHYLDHVLKLTESREVTASEDICNAQGTKLWARGSAITPALRDRLIRHKLAKPLETSLTIPDGITVETILREAGRLQEELSALRVFMGDKQAPILETLSQLQLHPVAAMLLTVCWENRRAAFHHGVLVSLIATSLAAHRGMTRYERGLLALAGLLHDIGELYINPDYLQGGRPLKPEEWKHLAVHPHLARILLDEFTDYPDTVLEAVAQHHERLDGSGYPRQLKGSEIGVAGQILSVAEMLSGVLMGADDVLARSCLALKCVPGEYPRDLVSLVSVLRREYGGAHAPASAGAGAEQTLSVTLLVAKAMTRAVRECERIAGAPTLPATVSALLERVQGRLAGLRKALVAAGIDECLEETHASILNPDFWEAHLEVEVVGREIGWRLRDIGRDLYLRLGGLDTASAATFSALIEILDSSAAVPSLPASSSSALSPGTS